ncbi:MAG: choline/ethanolamine kinase family protein [Pseudomonadota bacterium]
MTTISKEARGRIEALPLWQGALTIERLEGGLSNEGYIVSDAARQGDDARLVVRFGDDVPVHHVSRAHEAMATRAAHRAGFAPELVYAGDGILAVRFIVGRTYTATDVHNALPRIVDLLRRFHREMPTHVGGPGRLFSPFHIIRDYARTLEIAGSRFAPRLNEFRNASAAFEACQPAMHLVFGHSDLLPANLIDDGKRLWLIDYEYAGYASPLFDLANLASNAEFSSADDEALLQAYFGQTPDTALRHALTAMKCASLLREAMWSMVSEHHLDAPGVDYAAYSDEVLERYEREHARFAARSA